MSEIPKHPSHDTDEWELIESLFHRGFNLNEREQQQLLKPFGSRIKLIEEVLTLWRRKPHAHQLSEALSELSREFWHSISEQETPEFIGPYQILDQIGQGGMGIVYKGFQTAPAREVAIKVLPDILCSSTYVERFKAEQDRLGTLQHENIATAFDGGISENGQPFLVMELLDSLSIQEYCDIKKLSINERLKLVSEICKGIYHAHRQGIIHKDIKPSNILIKKNDTKVVPKIIDFGISALQPGAFEGPSIGIAGTPQYMSPEQANPSEKPIDVRSDIFSLGVLCFELLLGRTPLEEELKNHNDYLTRCKLVGQIVPESLGAQAKKFVNHSVATHRQTTVSSLKKELSGELDWILAKSLAHYPDDRYESALELSREIDRYLAGDPVEVGSGNKYYWWKKWIQRNRFSLLVSLIIVGLLIFALKTKFQSLIETQKSARHLRQVHAFSEGMFREVGPYYLGKDVKAIELLDQAAERIRTEYSDQPDLEQSIHLVVARSYRDLGFFEKAETHYSRAEALSLEHPLERDIFEIQGERAYNLFEIGSSEKAIHLYKNAQDAAIHKLGKDSEKALKLGHGLAMVMGRSNKQLEALVLFSKILKTQKDVLGISHQETLATMNNMADLHLNIGQYKEAELLLREALKHYPGLAERQDPFAASLTHNLALAFAGQNQKSAAIDLGWKVLTARRQILGHFHPHTLTTVNNLATVIGDSGHPNQAIQLVQETLVGFPDIGKSSSEYLRVRHTLGHFLMVTKDYEGAKEVLEKTWDIRKQVLGIGHLDTLKTHITLGEVLCEMGQLEDGLKKIESAIDLGKSSLGEDHHFYKLFLQVLAWAEAKKEEKEN